MHISGEEIRQEAEKREQTCSSGMKGSFYYGFREGAKWGIKEQKAIDEVERLNQVNQAYLDGRREKEEDMRMMLESQRKELIGKAIMWICENIDDYARLGDDGAWVDHNVAADFKKAMEE